MSDELAPPGRSRPRVNLRGRSRSNEQASIEATIQQWRLDEDKGGPLIGIALVHRPSDKELHTIILGGSPGRSDSDLAAIFLGNAQSYAEGISGVQSFELLGFYGSSGDASKDMANEPRAFKPFQIAGRTEFDGLATEAPDKTGVTAQGMRLTEMLVQGAFRAIEQGHNATRNILQDMGSENRELRTENRSMFTILKEMLVEQAKMTHERQMEEARYQRQSEERATLLRMAPALVNSVLGKDVFPQSTADTALIEAAVTHISTEQMQLLSGILPPEVWGPLSTRMQQILEEKQKAVLRTKELAKFAPPVDPDDPQAGEL